VIGAPKSKAGHRTVPLVLKMLREWKLKCPGGKQRLVFPTGNGNIGRTLLPLDELSIASGHEVGNIVYLPRRR
jgi:hypothetical protein